MNLDEGAGKELGTRYDIISLPTQLYFDSKSKLLHRSGGGKSAAGLIQDGKDACDPSKAFLTLRERYKAGDRTAAFLYAFSAAPGLAQESNLHDQVVRDYLKTQNAVELTSQKNLEYLFNQYAEFNSPATQYFLAHQSAFAAHFVQEAVTKRTRGIISQKWRQRAEKTTCLGLLTYGKLLSACYLSRPRSGKLLPRFITIWASRRETGLYTLMPSWPTAGNMLLATASRHTKW